MCGSSDDALKTRQHELILFNVTYENFKISYSFMVNLIKANIILCLLSVSFVAVIR